MDGIIYGKRQFHRYQRLLPILIQSDKAQEQADCSELHFFNFPKLLAHHPYAFRIILR